MNDYIDGLSEYSAKAALSMSEDAHGCVREVCERLTGVSGIPFIDDCVAASILIARQQGISDYIAYVESSR